MASEHESSKEAAIPDPGVKTETNGVDNNEDAGVTKEWKKPEAYDYSTFDQGEQQQQTWGSSAAVYEWDGEEGDIGPVHPELEREIFGDEEARKDIQGIDFTKYVREQRFLLC
jgi:ATP-dependent RNA helicase DDX3X